MTKRQELPVQLELLTWPAEADAFTCTVVRLPGNKRRAESCGSTRESSAVIEPFPQSRRHAKIIDVTTKLLAKTTIRAIVHYRDQVTEGMGAHLTSRQIPAHQHGEQVRRFWVAVDCEVARSLHGRSGPKGAA